MSKSRRYRKTPWEFILQNLWLVVPVGIIGLVVFLGVTRGRKTTDGPETHQSATNPQGIVEQFTVTTLGQALPARPENATLPGTAVPLLGRDHVPDGEVIRYNSNPPTSGPHYAQPAQWGIYDSAPQDERLVHNLEHGGIVISYNPDQISGQTLDQLRAQARELSNFNPRLVVTPRSNLGSAIALTAWGYLETLESYDSEAIKAFYDAHIARGPECQNGLCPD